MTHELTEAVWRCPTCKLPLENREPIRCDQCGKSVLAEGRFLDFRPLTPQLDIGLFPVLERTLEAEQKNAGTSCGESCGERKKSKQMSTNRNFRLRVERAIERVTRYASGGLCVEVGAGTGPMTPSLEKLFSHVIALDRFPKAIVEKTQSATCVAGDAHFLPLRDNCVDFLVLTEVLEHMSTPSQALLEIRRVLKPDGLAFVTVPNGRSTNPFTVTKKCKPRDTHVNFFDSVGLSRLIFRCGFELVDVRTHTPGLGLRKVLFRPRRLKKYLPALGKFVECLIRPAADPVPRWLSMLGHGKTTE